VKMFAASLFALALTACGAQSNTTAVTSCSIAGGYAAMGDSGEVMSVMGLTVFTDATKIDCNTKPVCTVEGNGQFTMQAEYLGKGKKYFSASNKAKVFVKKGEVVCHEI